MHIYSKAGIQKDTDYRTALNDTWTITSEMIEVGIPLEHILPVIRREYRNLFFLYGDKTWTDKLKKKITPISG